VNVRRSGGIASLDVLSSDVVRVPDRDVLTEGAFHRMISLERKRTERSRKPFLLMLLDMGDTLPTGNANGKALEKILPALAVTTRETDVTGWYRTNSVVGVMFTELGAEDPNSNLTTMMTRVSEALRSNLSSKQFNQISISFHLFPEEWNRDVPQRPSNPTLYPDLARRDGGRKFFCAIKRIMDVVGSALALLVVSPALLAIALAIKLTSKGPIFFRQKRVGQYGDQFVFLKFRSMYVNNDSSAHQEYVKQLIAGNAKSHPGNGDGEAVYKLTGDPRITRVGAFLRRTSLDELPQLFSILVGHLSFVGPRPALFNQDDLVAQRTERGIHGLVPGLTGWAQINGRDELPIPIKVQFDYEYLTRQSLRFDMQIIGLTIVKVARRDGIQH